MPQFISGNSATHYTGVNATTPPNFYLRNRPPTPMDWQEYYIGDEWMDNLSSSATYRSVWKNVGIQPQNAIWVLMTAGSGDLLALTADDLNVAIPDALGQIKIHGDRDITTNAATVHQVQVGLNNTITLGDLSVVPQGTPSLEVVTGDIDVDAGQLNVTSSFGAPDDFTAYNALLTNTGDNGIAARLFFKKTRNGNPVQVGNGLGTIRVSGFDGTQFTEAAIIQTIVDAGTVASGRVPGKINFYTHPDSVTAPFGGPILRMSIGSEGNVVINTPTSGVALTVNGFSAGTDAINATLGDIELTAGNIKMAYTNAAATQGIIEYDNLPWFHNYGSSAISQPNLFIGRSAGNFTLTGLNNICIGSNTGSSITSAAFTCALGDFALSQLTSAVNNVAIGKESQWINQTSPSNASCGNYTLRALTSGTGFNTCLGTGAGSLIVTGARNIFIGESTALDCVGAESSNIYLNNRGVAAESNAIRIGMPAGDPYFTAQNKCWIAGIVGVTTNVNDAIPVLIDSTGQLGTVSSSIRYKENIEDLNYYSGSIRKLRPVIFNYKNHAPELKSVGLIAEEVQEIIPSLVVKNKEGQPETIKYQDLPIYLLAELQNMAAQMRLHHEEIADLNKRIEKLEKK